MEFLRELKGKRRSRQTGMASPSGREEPKAPIGASIEAPLEASDALVSLAKEAWRFGQYCSKSSLLSDPFEGERFGNHLAWFMRKVQDVVEEAGLRTLDLTGEEYDIGMAVTALNLEDFPDQPGARYRIAQMVEPIVMERGKLRSEGKVMLEVWTKEQEEE